jgi:hypothetical protein
LLKNIVNGGIRHYRPTIMDTNYWGLWCVPLGLAICFWPALIATIFTKPADPTEHSKFKLPE